MPGLDNLERDYTPRAHRNPTDQTARKWQRGILAAIICGPLALAVATIAVTRQPTTTTTTTAPPTVNYQGVATLAINEWLAGQPITVPTLVRCGGSATEPLPLFPAPIDIAWQRGTVTTNNAGDTIEQHQFALNTGTGVYRATINLRTIDTNGATSAAVDACPAVAATARPDLERTQPTAGWDNATTLDSAPANIVTQTEAWAAAYFGANADALYRITGDTEERAYLPLGGVFTPTSVRVITAALNTDSTQILANVSVTASRNNEPSITMSFDLLFVNPRAALPPVVAWGSPGTGSTLTPYRNGYQTGTVTGADNTPSAAPTTTTASAVITTPDTAPPATEAPDTTEPATTIAAAQPPTITIGSAARAYDAPLAAGTATPIKLTEPGATGALVLITIDPPAANTLVFAWAANTTESGIPAAVINQTATGGPTSQLMIVNVDPATGETILKLSVDAARVVLDVQAVIN